MPDLGKYTGDVLAAYGVSLAILAVLIGISLVQARRSKQRLQQAEQRAQDRLEKSAAHG
jgi:heme exporter protein D